MRRLALAVAVVVGMSASASAQVVYNNGFGANNNGFSANTATQTTPNDCTAIYCGQYLGTTGSTAYLGGGSGSTFANSDVATLLLSGLGAHTAGTLIFKLFI